MSDVLIGIDLGTTILKAAAFDACTGTALARSTGRLPITVGPDGAREQPTASIDRALRSVLGDLRRQLGRRWQNVAGIGLAAQGGSATIADRRTGKSLAPMMLWNDARPYRYLARVKRGRPAEFWRQATLRDEPGMGLGRMLWLRDTRPELLTDANVYAGAGEYACFKLTGLWRQDAGNALQIGCYNTVERRLDQRLLNAARLPLTFVAPMREGHEVHPLTRQAARALGLPEDTPVAGPYMDHEAGYLSASGVSRRPLQCSLGTAWVGNFALPAGTKWASPFQLVLPAPSDVLAAGPDRHHRPLSIVHRPPFWMVCQPLLTGNVTWDWGLRTLVDADLSNALAQLDRVFAKDVLPPDGLAALPWLNRPNPLVPDSLGAGGFFGVGPQTTWEHLLRALAASMACELARVFANVKSSGHIDSVVLGGGASKGSFFRTLLAALFAPLPVYAVDEEDIAGARGTLFAFSRTVARAAARRAARPDKNMAERVARGYALYSEVLDRMYGDEPASGAVTIERRSRR